MVTSASTALERRWPAGEYWQAHRLVPLNILLDILLGKGMLRGIEDTPHPRWQDQETAIYAASIFLINTLFPPS